MSSNKVTDGGWEVVGNAKRDKYQARKASKKAEEAAQDPAPAEAVVEKAKPAAVEEPADQNKSAKSKAKAKKPTTLNISNDQEMIKALQQVLSQAQNGFFLASVVSERIQALTGQAWNKKFKTQFGPLITFIKTHPTAFHIVDDSKVYDIAVWNKLNGIAAPKKGGKQDKQPAAAAPGKTEAPKAAAPAAAVPAKTQAAPAKSQQQPAKGGKNNRKQNSQQNQQEKAAAASGFSAVHVAVVVAVLAAGYAYLNLSKA